MQTLFQTKSLLFCKKFVRASSLRFSTVVKSANQKKSVAIIGTGAVGGYYGARLHQAGVHDVKFFMRNPHFDHCSSEGLDVQSVDGNFYVPADDLNIFSKIEDMGKADWIILSIKSSFLNEVPSLLKSLFKEDGSTKVLTIMNGLIDEDLVDLLIPYSPAAIYGGMAFICSNRSSPGFINHSSYGLLNIGLAHSYSATKNIEAIDILWSKSKVSYTFVPSLIRGRWEKNCYNLPFSGISVANGGISIDKIIGNKSLRDLTDKIIHETITLANTHILSRGEKTHLLGEDERQRMWYLSENMGIFYPSTSLDFLDKKPIEFEYLFMKPLHIAKELNVSTPFLEEVVSEIDRIRVH